MLEDIYFAFRRLLCKIGILDIDKEIAMLDREIEKEMKKLTNEERQEVLYIISNGRYGHSLK